MCVSGVGVGNVNSNVFLRGHTLELYIIKLVDEVKRALLRVMSSALHLEALNRIWLCRVYVSMLVRVFCMDMQSSMVLMSRYTLVSSA